MNANRKVRWGILSTAKIGREYVIPALQASVSGEVSAIASRDVATARRAANKLGVPAATSAIHSLANSPDWISASICCIACLVCSVTMRGPRVTSPYSAVSETEYRIQERPPSKRRSTMSFSSWSTSKYAISGS